jgi:hypothetical protein
MARMGRAEPSLSKEPPMADTNVERLDEAVHTAHTWLRDI